MVVVGEIVEEEGEVGIAGEEVEVGEVPWTSPTALLVVVTFEVAEEEDEVTSRIEEEEVVVVAVVDGVVEGSVGRVSSGGSWLGVELSWSMTSIILMMGHNETDKENPFLKPMQMSRRSKRRRPRSLLWPARSPPGSPSILTDLDMAHSARQSPSMPTTFL